METDVSERRAFHLHNGHETHGQPPATPEKTDVLIVGAGIAGLSSALLLARSGHRVVVCEKRSLASLQSVDPLRTLNFTLSERGRRSLDRIGCLSEALRLSVKLAARRIHLAGGIAVSVPYGTRPKDALHSIERRDLHALLLERASREHAITTLYGAVPSVIDIENGRAEFLASDATVRIKFNLLVGADGVHSTVRARLEHLRHVQTERSVSNWQYREIPRIQSKFVGARRRAIDWIPSNIDGPGSNHGAQKAARCSSETPRTRCLLF